MSTTQTTLFAPPLRGSIEKWLLTLQFLLPLRVVDTSADSYSENAPPAGSASSSMTGQSNQNQEIIYIKSSSDANTFTLNGVQGGPFVLTDLLQSIRIKSDGTDWWPVGTSAPNFSDAEIPAGVINGANLTFTLAHAPNPAGSLLLFNNGTLQVPGTNFTLSGDTITFAVAPTGNLLAWYRW
jgi:hypothetical protein